MDRSLLTDEQWAVILAFLLRHPHVYVGNPLTCRAFLEAVLWVLRSGGQWRLLPAARGAWNHVFKRFARWQRRGVWAELQAHVVRDPDLQQLLIDGTVVRAHPCAAGAEQSSAEAEALGRSRGGFGTKIHAVTDALGYPLVFVLTGGQASDIGQAERLIGAFPAHAVIGDKGYDSDAFVKVVEERGMQAIIPPRSNRLNPRVYDRHLYKERHLVECFFNKIKHYRRIFSRFEKTAHHFMAFLHLVAFLIWTR
jgi:transposase